MFSDVVRFGDSCNMLGGIFESVLLDVERIKFAFDCHSYKGVIDKEDGKVRISLIDLQLGVEFRIYPLIHDFNKSPDMVRCANIDIIDFIDSFPLERFNTYLELLKLSNIHELVYVRLNELKSNLKK